MAGKSSRSYVPLYDTQPQPVEQSREDESLWYFPAIRIAEEDDSFADLTEPQRRSMSSQAASALENNKPCQLSMEHAGSSKKVEAFCCYLSHKFSAHLET